MCSHVCVLDSVVEGFYLPNNLPILIHGKHKWGIGLRYVADGAPDPGLVVGSIHQNDMIAILFVNGLELPLYNQRNEFTSSR